MSIPQSKLQLITPDRYEDERGFFTETYNAKRLAAMGIIDEFVQDNHSYSVHADTIRGLHFQVPPYAQAKLVRCVRGAILDVVVDIRTGSPTYGQCSEFELTAKNGKQLYVPLGYAHGFITLKPETEVVYKVSKYYNFDAEQAIRWDSCRVVWPLVGDPILSAKDSVATDFKRFNSPFIYGENS